MRITLFIAFLIVGCLFNQGKCGEQPKNNSAKVTFIELGSVNCIPCKKMAAVMKSIEYKFGNQVKVIFYDIWKADQKKYAKQYNVSIIPTQVFLDQNGKEFFRHQGYYAEAEIEKLLKKRGIKPIR